MLIGSVEKNSKRKLILICVISFLLILFAYVIYQYFRDLVINTGTVQVYSFTENNIVGFYYAASLTLFLLVSLYIYRWIELKESWFIILKIFLFQFLNYLVFILEICVGLLITASFVGVEYSNFDPKIIFLTMGFIAFILLEFVRKKLFMDVQSVQERPLRNEKNKDPLYIRALQWASDRGSSGFKMNELKEAVAEDEEEWAWVQRMMIGEINGEPTLIFHLGPHHTGGEYTYSLTSSGASALLDYLELREARKSSKQAMYVAIASLGIATLVGIAQIVVQIWFK